MDKKFTEYGQLNLSDVNKEVLKAWDEKDVFAKSMTEREGCPSFVFYEGPPSANGMPGIHHVMARAIKDTLLHSCRTELHPVLISAGASLRRNFATGCLLTRGRQVHGIDRGLLHIGTVVLVFFTYDDGLCSNIFSR